MIQLLSELGKLMIINATLITGIIIGAICLLAAVHNHIRYQNFGLGGVVLVAFGSMLLGLSIWKSIEISIDTKGNITAKYQRNQDVGAKVAEQNSRFVRLELKFKDISKDIDLLKSKKFAQESYPSQLKIRGDIKAKFKQNSKYSILVFNKPKQDQTAKEISKALLESGYKSSSIFTILRKLNNNLKVMKHG